ncbi:MAG: FtsX-like permease family protein [Mediterranea massiliensis]|nr:FtsX-like permease family protein [Mediterranea massiliensis]
MIAHYLKVAVRNLLKYKVQSIISIVGLAIGLATFALSSIWLKYELTYDTHWPDAERIYEVGRLEEGKIDKFENIHALRDINPLKEQYPEIEEVCAVVSSLIYINGEYVPHLNVDTAYTHIFPLTILEGTDQFIYAKDMAAITEGAALRLFGTTDVLGDTINGYPNALTICAILKDGDNHTDYPYEVVSSIYNKPDVEDIYLSKFFIKLFPNTDVEAFNEKLKQHKVEYTSTLGNGTTTKYFRDNPLTIAPLSEIHYTHNRGSDAIRLEHIRMFNVVGLVVVICALLNYLILYVIRLYIRRREMTLRRVHGAGEGSLLRMTMTELLLLIGISTCFGLLITELLFAPFKEIAKIDESSGFLYRESAIYMGMVILLSLLLSGVMLLLQQRRSHRASLLPIASSGGIFTFRRVAMGVQLFISIFVLFATFTLQKQLRQLHHSDDMGINLDVIMAEGWTMWAERPTEEIDGVMEEIPYINYYKTEHYPFDARAIIYGSTSIRFVNERDEEQTIKGTVYRISHDAYRVYGLQVVAGEIPAESNVENGCWINESFATQMGITPTEAIGLSIDASYHGPGIIRGVIKNISISPIIPSPPGVYIISANDEIGMGGFNYRLRFLTSDIKDMKVLEDSVTNHLKRKYPNEENLSMDFYTIGEDIERALQSERVLMKLLGIASGVCIFITLFGIFSMVSLTCERRRKEMAIRKVHGARIRDIIGLFAKEYGILLLLSAAVAFSVGYAVMKQWLQTYVIQTTISWWIYVAILAAVTLMIVLCVGYRVWKAANENPADVVKSE